MELLDNLALGFSIALSPYTLMLAIVGCFLGTIIGALPGLGPSNGVAILIPITFTLGLDATSALVLMTSVYYGAMYGGRISSILLNIPGDEPALMTTLDGYPMAKNGRAGDALVLSGVASFVGALLATIGLMLIAPMLARVAFLFGPAEYFALYLLAFCTLGTMTFSSFTPIEEDFPWLSMKKNTSAMANNPTMATRKSIPSIRCKLPPV